MTPSNQAAWLREAGKPLEVGDAPMPSPGPDEIVVRNAAVAINPVDCHMRDLGVFVQQWPNILGCDVAGTVHDVGADAATRFKKGDRVIGHTINLVTSNPEHGAYALYTVVSMDKAAILPGAISFTDGVVIPFALEAAVCALSVKIPGTALPGVSTPALGLPYPLLDPQPTGKILVVNGGSSSTGSMTTQVATAAGIRVVSVASERNFHLCRESGSSAVFDYHDSDVTDKVVKEVRDSGLEFVGIFDAISTPDTYAIDLKILNELGGGHLACTHPPPEGVSDSVEAGMIFAVDDVATPVWTDFVGQALAAGQLKCLPPPRIVGTGLEHVQEALDICRSGVSATKLVVRL